MRLYLVRHGESDLNKQRKYQYPEVELSKTGLLQAKQVARRFKNIPIDVIISSDIVRAKQTTKEIVAVTKKKVVFTPLLHERRCPSALHGKSIASEEAKQALNLIHKNRYDPKWRHSDEENFFDAIKRVKALISLVEKRTEENILIVSHAAFLKYLLTHLLFEEGANPDHFEKIYYFFGLKNTGVSILEKKNDQYGTGVKWRLVTWNDHAHLG